MIKKLDLVEIANVLNLSSDATTPINSNETELNKDESVNKYWTNEIIDNYSDKEKAIYLLAIDNLLNLNDDDFIKYVDKKAITPLQRVNTSKAIKNILGYKQIKNSIEDPKYKIKSRYIPTASIKQASETFSELNRTIGDAFPRVLVDDDIPWDSILSFASSQLQSKIVEKIIQLLFNITGPFGWIVNAAFTLYDAIQFIDEHWDKYFKPAFEKEFSLIHSAVCINETTSKNTNHVINTPIEKILKRSKNWNLISQYGSDVIESYARAINQHYNFIYDLSNQDLDHWMLADYYQYTYDYLFHSNNQTLESQNNIRFTNDVGYKLVKALAKIDYDGNLKYDGKNIHQLIKWYTNSNNEIRTKSIISKVLKESFIKINDINDHPKNRLRAYFNILVYFVHMSYYTNYRTRTDQELQASNIMFARLTIVRLLELLDINNENNRQIIAELLSLDNLLASNMKVENDGYSAPRDFNWYS